MKLFERSVEVLPLVILRRERVLDVEHRDAMFYIYKLSIMLARQSVYHMYMYIPSSVHPEAEGSLFLTTIHIFTVVFGPLFKHTYFSHV